MIARRVGRVVVGRGETVVAMLPGASVGDAVRVRSRGGRALAGEIAAVERERIWIAPFGSIDGIAIGDRVESDDTCALPSTGALLGRAIDAAASPLDGGPALARSAYRVERRNAPAPSDRTAIERTFWTGVPALDAMLPLGRGARVGIFGAPGSGKSSLLDAIVAGADADAVVLALVGERGREARDWIGRLNARTTIVCATSDRAASERMRAAHVAMSHACALREAGFNVLLVVDSLARYTAAVRERRTALGEATGRGGYPAGVWFDLARYLERAGNGPTGSVTMLATVLSDGADDREPLSDAARSLLDGHVVLSATLAHAGRFPAIDVLASASRTMQACASAAHARDAALVRAALARFAETKDARELGFVAPDDPAAVAASAYEATIEAFLRSRARTAPATTLERLAQLARALEGAG